MQQTHIEKMTVEHQKSNGDMQSEINFLNVQLQALQKYITTLLVEKNQTLISMHSSEN